jgi:3-oxoisoapionate decarboxylase
MKVGISSWAFPWAVGIPSYPRPAHPLTPFTLVSRAAEWGAEVVQIADNLPLDRLAAGELRALRNQAENAGIVLEASTRGVDPAHLDKYLKIASALDSRLVRTLAHHAEPHPNLREIEAQLREVLPEFSRAGVSIALENYEAYTSRELAELVTRVNSHYLGICLDTTNSFGALEGLDQAIATLLPYVINVHVKDFAITRTESSLGFIVAGRPAGEGKLNIRGLLEQIGRYGRNPNLVLEQWPPFCASIDETVRNEADWAARGMRYLKGLG